MRKIITICLIILPYALIGTRAGAGVDSAWKQGKPEARKMLENRAESHQVRTTPCWAVFLIYVGCLFISTYLPSPCLALFKTIYLSDELHSDFL
jgi:hypothetical protein